MTHYAFDFGILDLLGKTKTKKTLCNITVKSHSIDNENPTCENCKKTKRDMESLLELLQTKS